MVGSTGINNMSVAEYAELLGISTQAVYKRIKDDNLEVGKVAKNGKRTYITVTNEELQRLQGDYQQDNKPVAPDHAAEIAALRELIVSKDAEIQRLQTENDRLHEHLSVAQTGWNEATRQVGLLQHKVNQLESVILIEQPEEPAEQEASAMAQEPDPAPEAQAEQASRCVLYGAS